MPYLVRRTPLLLAAALAWLGGCDSPSDVRAGPPARLDVVSGNSQHGTVARELASPLVVRVVDAAGKAVRGQVVNFVVVSGGGSVFAGTAVTNHDGVAQERWTLGTMARDTQRVEARAVDPASGAPLVFATFAAVGTPAAPASIVPLNGDTMVAGAAGSLVEDSIAVVVRDAHGNRVPGATVSWATTAGGGTFRQATTTSDTGGVARGEWVLGPAEFRQMAQASIPGAAPVRFTSWAATAIRALSGSGETARAGFTLAVAALLANGDAGVPDVPVRWQVTSGGGSVTPALSRSGGFPQNGVATAQWTLGPALGTQTLTATVGALQATFTATVVTGGSRVLVAQVPGRVYDADGTRLLWRDDRGAPAVLKVRTLASGADQVVNGPAGWRPAQGRLVPGGAVVVDSAAEGLGLHEWLGGTHVALGPVRDWDVDGEWLAWSTRTRVMRRTLATRTTRVLAEVSDFSFSSVDVDANGHVAWTDLGRLWLFRGTSNELVTTRVAPSGRGNVLPPVIDGPNVVYGISDPASDWTGIALLHAGGHEFLMPPMHYFPQGTPIVSRGAHYDARGGWVAFVRFLDITGTRAPVYRRSPAGALQRLTAEDTRGQLDALGADGSVVFRVGSRRFVSAGGTMFDVGAVAPGERVVWRGGRFYLLADGNVYELAP